jgi:hypothetical protein
MPTYVDRKCESCGNPFKATLSKVNIGKGRFCSPGCANAGQRKDVITSRYRYITVKSHPLKPEGGKLPAHRVALYDKIGAGPHACHWCGKKISWDVPPSADGCIDTDHLDDNRHNNDPANLVPSCHRCNIIRTHDRRFADKSFVISTTARTRRSAVERTCQRPGCGKKFLVETALIGKDPERKGKYCSKECLWNRNRPVT